MIDIVIADDHALVRMGLRQIIKLAPDLRVVADVADGQQLLALLSARRCDLVLMDMAMPGCGGVQLIKRIRHKDPAPPVLVLSMHDEGELVFRALKAGASGYLTKDAVPETLLSAIRKVARGERYIDPTLVDELVFDYGLGDGNAPHKQLSDREFQVFQMLVAGLAIKQIAERLSVSSKTISTHKLRLMQKMRMRSMAELVRYAVENGLADGGGAYAV